MLGDRWLLDATSGLQGPSFYPTKLKTEDYATRTMEGGYCFGNMRMNKHTKLLGKTHCKKHQCLNNAKYSLL
jgi:hypothetical protein